MEILAINVPSDPPPPKLPENWPAPPPLPEPPSPTPDPETPMPPPEITPMHDPIEP